MAEEDVNLYDEIEIEDCFYDETLQIYHHPCPCGDRFEISIYDMRDGEDIARCPSCSLMIRIIFDPVRPGCRCRGTLLTAPCSPIFPPTRQMRRSPLPSLRKSWFQHLPRCMQKAFGSRLGWGSHLSLGIPWG